MWHATWELAGPVDREDGDAGLWQGVGGEAELPSLPQVWPAPRVPPRGWASSDQDPAQPWGHTSLVRRISRTWSLGCGDQAAGGAGDTAHWPWGTWRFPVAQSGQSSVSTDSSQGLKELV